MVSSNRSIVVIVQARTSSTRLPGKVLTEIVTGKSLLDLQLERLMKSALADMFVVATSSLNTDDRLAQQAALLGAQVFRGSQDDVLARFVGAAHAFNAGVVVRICADSPLHDVEILDRCIQAYLDNCHAVDYISNLTPESFPYGTAVEVFPIDVLLRLDRLTRDMSLREHVTQFLHQNKQLFRLFNVYNDYDLSHMRWAVDFPEDLTFAKRIYEKLYCPPRIFGFREVLSLLDRSPQLALINAGRNQRQPKQ